MHPELLAVTNRIRQRSKDSRAAYLARCLRMQQQGPSREQLSCSNLAHGFASCSPCDKSSLKLMESANIGIVSSYNDMLSAHQPLERFPAIIKQATHERGCTAQFAGGVPAMCDGITQGQPGMELSLFSRDIIAAATAVSLSHNMFDAGMCLGVCDKIVPGLLIGALSFGHLPFVFVPAGPMRSGLPNKEKAAVRQQFAAGEVGRDELLNAESKSYHSPGTCTFYGTANSNQMLLEFMGLHMPGTAFVNPDDPLRDELTRAAALRVTEITALGKNYIPLYEIVTEKCLVNAIVGLLATGGSTNHAIHWIAIAQAAGFIIDWQDYAELSNIIPLLTRIYPNGSADVNHFHAAGGVPIVINELVQAGLLHDDVMTLMGEGLAHHYTRGPTLLGNDLAWQEVSLESNNTDILRGCEQAFSKHGGLALLQGNLGRAIIKTSALASEHLSVQAPAVVCDTQEQVKTLFEKGELNRDCVVVVRFQGPAANGMPELHKLTPYLGVLQDKGFAVALLTDGRMSGASGKVPAAIHLTPEAKAGGPIAKIRDGDMITLDSNGGILALQVEQADFDARDCATQNNELPDLGRDLFGFMRNSVNAAEQGATVFNWSTEGQQE
ncbi:MAG: phosphogluconate dehydratase [Pseudomonadales bacterium]